MDLTNTKARGRQKGRHMTTHTFNRQTYDLISDYDSQKGTQHEDRPAGGPLLQSNLDLA
jgi:hypothetical protein